MAVDQDLIALNTARYVEALSGEEKRVVSFHIVDEIERSGGRFLMRGHRCWIPITRDEARLKVAQAFQYQRRKAKKVEEIHPSIAPPPLLRQNHYYPGTHSQEVPRKSVLDRSETDTSSAPIDALYSRNDDVLPSVASFSFETDRNHNLVAQSTIEKINDDCMESADTELKHRCAKVSSSQQQKFGTSIETTSLDRYNSHSIKDNRRIQVNKGKSDPNERNVAKFSEYPTAADAEMFQTASHPTIGIRDVESFNQSPSSNEHEEKRSFAGKRVEATLDGSGVHSIGMSSSDEEQESLVSVLANMDADVWTENEDLASKFLK